MSIRINGRSIGPGFPVYVIAEISANHNQDFSHAVELVHTAKQVGADAVKLQTYTADTLTLRCDKPHFRISGGTLWDNKTLHELYSEAYMPWDWQPKLKAVADEIGIELFSSPFDESAVEFLEKMGVAAYKVASFEIVDLGLIRRIARTGKPMIISTGMATLSEMEEALGAARSAGATQIALLKCTSAYPAPADDMNLRGIQHLSQKFDVPVGLSDHTIGIAVPAAAVALGASIIEKHITQSRATSGPDSAFSLEPKEFAAMVETVRTVEKSLGSIQDGPTQNESKSLVFRRSLFVVKSIRAGERFTNNNVRSIRPAYGLHPRELGNVIGRKAARDIEAGTALSWDLIAGLPLRGSLSGGNPRTASKDVQ